MPDLLSQISGLNAFVQSVNAGSFSSAARSLKTSPSVISRRVSRLETALGTQLFRRSTRALTLTQEGNTFFAQVAPLLDQLANANDVLETGLSGRLKISLPSELAKRLLKPLLARFSIAEENLQFEINMSDGLQDVIRDNYDVVFRVGPLSSSEMTARKLADLNMVIVASPHFIQQYGVPKTPKQLNEYPFVLFAGSAASQKIMFRDGTFVHPSGPVTIDSGAGLLEAAKLGIGAAYVMECIAQDDLESGRLEKLETNIEPAPMPLHAVHTFGQNPPRKIGLICDLIRDELKPLHALV
jgi:DNA-binding transcriptional LysR family regulator